MKIEKTGMNCIVTVYEKNIAAAAAYPVFLAAMNIDVVYLEHVSFPPYLHDRGTKGNNWEVREKA